MNSHCTRRLAALGLLLTLTARTQANDIVDFLRAINGVSEHHQTPPANHQVGHHQHGASGNQAFGYDDQILSSRDIHKHNMQLADRNAALGTFGSHGYAPDRFSQNPYGPDRLGRNQTEMYDRIDLRDRSNGQSDFGRSGVQWNFRVSSNGETSPMYGRPISIPSQQPQTLPPVQSYPPVQVVPCEIGEIVDCPMPLATCVRIEDECNIAPNAIPLIVAVRDPSLCVHACHERLVFVRVFAPPCPLRGLTVSPCGTRVCMEFGQYQIDIKSKHGLIVVDYDN